MQKIAVRLKLKINDKEIQNSLLLWTYSIRVSVLNMTHLTQIILPYLLTQEFIFSFRSRLRQFLGTSNRLTERRKGTAPFYLKPSCYIDSINRNQPWVVRMMLCVLTL